MTLTEDLTTHTLISHYTPKAIHIKEKSYKTSILLTPAGQVIPWDIHQLDEIDLKYCQEIIRYHPEIVLIGTGIQHQFPSLDIVRYFANHKIGIEVMSTSAACRTYNVLVLENRQILAGLML